jgi:hypothetical protein
MRFCPFIILAASTELKDCVIANEFGELRKLKAPNPRIAINLKVAHDLHADDRFTDIYSRS